MRTTGIADCKVYGYDVKGGLVYGFGDDDPVEGSIIGVLEVQGIRIYLSDDERVRVIEALGGTDDVR